MNTVNSFIKHEAVLLSLITSRRGAEGLLDYVTLEHQIKSFDLEDKNVLLTFKMEKKTLRLSLLVLQLIKPLAGLKPASLCRKTQQNPQTSSQLPPKNHCLQSNCKLSACAIKHASLALLICQ